MARGPSLRTARIVLLLLVVVAAAFYLLRPALFKDRGRGPPIGMTERPCADNGGPVTGKAGDDWAGLCAYRQANRKLVAANEPPAAVMIGDSLTAQWPGLPKDIANRGIGGQTSAQVLLRFRQDSVDLRPPVVHILVGINDTAGNVGPNAPDMFMANIKSMAELARSSGVEPVLGTIPPVRDYDWKPQLSPGSWIGTLNRLIRDYAQAENIEVADYHRVMALPDGTINPALYRDGAHPNAAGYAAMRTVLDASLESARTSKAGFAAR